MVQFRYDTMYNEITPYFDVWYNLKKNNKKDFIKICKKYGIDYI